MVGSFERPTAGVSWCKTTWAGFIRSLTYYGAQDGLQPSGDVRQDGGVGSAREARMHARNRVRMASDLPLISVRFDVLAAAEVIFTP
jgi:hypothetical protein